MRLVFDIEADNLLPKISKFHCAGAINPDTGEEFWFLPHQSQEFLNKLDEAEVIIAHNANGYDIPALKKLFGWEPKAKIYCTKVMSQVLNYRRFGFGHSLKQWGQFFKDFKGDYSGGFEEFNQEMFTYMKQDVRLTVKVFNYLLEETKKFIKSTNSKKILDALRQEIDMDAIMAEQCENGWLFNVEESKRLLTSIDKRMQEIAEEINPQLQAKVSVVDPNTIGVYKDTVDLTDPDHVPVPVKNVSDVDSFDDIITHEPTTGKRYAIEKKPTYTKTGKLNSHVQRWFGLPDGTTVNDSPVWGAHCRISFVNGDIGNTDTVKSYLGTIGWKPDEWNYKRLPDGEFTKVSAKLTDSSLEQLGDIGKKLSEYYTLRSRKSIIEGWQEYVDNSNRLHGDVFNIGTPTFRQTHKIIANLPSGKATLGPEIRKLFIARKGYKLVSADSAACQLRLLAHFMKDPKFTKELLEGDVHQLNADIIGCDRNQAKRFIFAYLYGAGAQKLSGYIDKSVDETKIAMNRYKKALPALAKLIQNTTNDISKQGYIFGLDNRPIFLSKDQKHKSLNYLIQGSEAVVMKATVRLIHQKLKEAKIDSKILLFYHDEVTYEIEESKTEEARKIIMECFDEAPKQYGINIMTCGDCNIGNDYYEVH